MVMMAVAWLRQVSFLPDMRVLAQMLQASTFSHVAPSDACTLAHMCSAGTLALVHAAKCVSRRSMQSGPV